MSKKKTQLDSKSEKPNPPDKVRFSVTLDHDIFKRLCLAAIESKPLTKPHKKAEEILTNALKERKG